MKKKDKDNIWNASTWRFLYTQLVKKFGPHNEWETLQCPNREKKEEFNSFLCNFASIIGAKSGEAVSQQVAFAITKQLACSSTRNLMSNKIYAYECGFIGIDYFPKEMLMENKSKNELLD